jgi:hypothetical protein
MEHATTEELAEWERRHQEHLGDAVIKVSRSQAPGLKRMPTFTRDELKALLHFIRKHHDE